MLKYMKLSRRTDCYCQNLSLDLERGIELFTQQASESTASSYVSCYLSPTIKMIPHVQKLNEMGH